MEAEFSGRLVDRIAGDGKGPVKKVDTLGVEGVIPVLEVAKELDRVRKVERVGSNLVCV